MKVAGEFSENYPIATRHIYESQSGIILQLIYVLTGKRIASVSVHSPYQRETAPDSLGTTMPCPVKFGEPLTMIFDKEILKTHITDANLEMLLIAELLISQLRDKEQP